MSYKGALAATIIFFIVSLIILIYKDFLAFPDLYQDEHHYLPTALLFSKEIVPSIELLKTYNQLNTPLPFILGGWVVRLFGEDIQHLRLMNFVLAAGVLLLFIWYKPVTENRRWLVMAPLLAMPSFYLCAIHYYTDMIAWVSVLLGVAAYLNQKHLLACLAFVAAIASRQYMLAFPLAIGLFEGLKVMQAESWKTRRFWEKLFSNRNSIIYGVAVFSIIPWILLWDGPAPSAIMEAQYYGDAPVYNVGFVVYASAIAGFYYVIPETVILKRWRYFLDYPARYPWHFRAIVVIVAGLLVSFPPRQAHNEYFTWPYLGYLDQLLVVLKVPVLLKNVIFGSLMSITLMRFIQPGVLSLSGLFVIVNILLLGKAQLSWDKYFFPVLLVLTFITMHREERIVKLDKSSAPPEKGINW